MLSFKLGPALAAGNAVIVKPSELTPLTALRLCPLFVEAGFPDGVINVVSGYGSTAGQALSEHMDVDKITFTGSTLTGRKIMETASKTNLKKITLELGGKGPSVIFDDVDLEQTVKWVSHGILYVTCIVAEPLAHSSQHESWTSVHCGFPHIRPSRDIR